MTIKPRLHVADEAPKTGLDATTWEQRRRLTAEELIKLMDSLHVNHPQFKPRSRSLLPMPNLAGKQPVIQHCDVSLFGQLRALLQWILR